MRNKIGKGRYYNTGWYIFSPIHGLKVLFPMNKRISAKPIKMKKDRTIFQDMIEHAVDVVTQYHELLLTEVPKNISQVERPA